MSLALDSADAGFAGFLKTWRARRRLSQLDLALEAGLSQRHISFLETGRSKPSRFAIAQLGEALGMPAAEIDAMLLSAGFAARSSGKGWSEETQRAVEASVDHVLQGHAPYPAVAVDRIWNLQKANAPAQQFFALIGPMSSSNLLRELMAPGPLRSAIANWEHVAQALFRMLELEVARRPHDEEAHHLADELRRLDGVSNAIAQPSLENPQPVLTIRFCVGDTVLELFSLIATIGMSADAAMDDVRIETLLPANEATRVWFDRRFG